jgi:hypothetical protein
MDEDDDDDDDDDGFDASLPLGSRLFNAEDIASVNASLDKSPTQSPTQLPLLSAQMSAAQSQMSAVMLDSSEEENYGSPIHNMSPLHQMVSDSPNSDVQVRK